MKPNHSAFGRTVGQVLHPGHHFLSRIAPLGERNPLVDQIGFMGQKLLVEVDPKSRLSCLQTNQILREPAGGSSVFDGGHHGPKFPHGLCPHQNFKPLMCRFIHQKHGFRALFDRGQTCRQCLGCFGAVQAHRTPRRLDQFNVFAEDKSIDGLKGLPHGPNIRSQHEVVWSAQDTKIVFHTTFAAGSKTVSNFPLFHVPNLLGQQPLQQIFGVGTGHLHASPLCLIHHGHTPAKSGILQFDGVKHGHHRRCVIAFSPADPVRLGPTHPVPLCGSGSLHFRDRLGPSLFRPLAPSLMELEERVLAGAWRRVGLVGIHTFHGMPPQLEVSSRALNHKPD